MAKWQRAVCVLTILAGGATMIANSMYGIQRGNDMIAFNEQVQAIRERRQHIEMPGIDESSRLRCEMAHRDIDREEKQLYTDRLFASEGAANKLSLVTIGAGMSLFAVGLTLGFVWRDRTPPAAGSYAQSAG